MKYAAGFMAGWEHLSTTSIHDIWFSSRLTGYTTTISKKYLVFKPAGRPRHLSTTSIHDIWFSSRLAGYTTTISKKYFVHGIYPQHLSTTSIHDIYPQHLSKH
jgi:frataxin-like iron-binding protein CyaY